MHIIRIKYIIRLFNNYLPHQYIFTYNKSQTTSTKCQYQAAASNPKWCEDEKWPINIRIKQTIKKEVPINTWRPWNPVVTKKEAP